MKEDQEKNTGHNYDGIEELDNNLPKWWLGILYGSIVFAAGYFGYYVIGNGPGLNKQYETDHAKAEYDAYLRGGGKKGVSEAELLAVFKNPDRIKRGHAAFQARCIACHGAQGQGGIGPNLTDDFWLHGGKLTEIVKTITDGVADKGMPPWGPILKEDEIQSLAGYIRSLHGTNPPGAKAPQGEKVTLAE